MTEQFSAVSLLDERTCQHQAQLTDLAAEWQTSARKRSSQYINKVCAFSQGISLHHKDAERLLHVMQLQISALLGCLSLSYVTYMYLNFDGCTISAVSNFVIGCVLIPQSVLRNGNMADSYVVNHFKN